MKKKLFILLIIITSFPLYGLSQQPDGLLVDLMEHTGVVWQNGYPSTIPLTQTNDAIEPVQFVEIRSTHPSFSWIVPGQTNGTGQTRYHIIVSDSFQTVAKGIGDVWDSGMTTSSQSTSVLLKGEPLKPHTTYFWRVKVETNTEGESSWSDIQPFRTASTLSTYQTSTYPQVKEMQNPVAIKQVAEDVHLADFGKDAFGQLLLTVSSGKEPRSIQIHLGECLSNGRVDRKPGGTIRYQAYTLQLMEGTHTYRIKIRKDARNTRPAAILMPDYIGEVLPFRYCEIEGYADAIKPNQLMREMVYYPFNESASYFQCSNDTLNQIWDLCKYSIKATSFAGIYVDGDRERIPYEADALINQLCHYGVDREYSMARRSYEYLLHYPTWPTEWILQAVQMAWYDYLYTGDTRSLHAHYDILKARTLLALRDQNGLISTTTGMQTPDFLASIHFKEPVKDIVDWPHTGILGLNKHEGGEADAFVFTDYNVVTNAYHYEALKRMAQISEILNKTDEASAYAREAKQFKQRFNTAFYDPKRKVYTDGTTTDHASLHGNMFPLAFGMVPPNETKSVLQLIKSRGMACSVYGSQFLMDALYEANDAAYAFEMLTKTDDRSWYNMIRVGSTISLEAWDNKYKPNQDWNHAWGAAPANLIPRKLMGVEPLEPGFSHIRIKPQPASLEWAKAVIPTIKGSVHMAIQNQENEFRLQVTIPPNMSADVYLPVSSGTYKVWKNKAVIQASRVKGEPFLSVGKLPSGSYEFVAQRKQ